MILDQFRLDGQNALVTGAATGLGQSMAIALAQAGANIVGCTHRSPTGQLQAAVEKHGRQFAAITADLNQPQTMADTAAQAVEALGGIDILINNAGTIRRNDFLDFTEQDWDQVLNVNLKSLFMLSQAIVRHMIDTQRQGKIVHVASMLSFQGGIRVPSYTASKHGVVGLTRLMANELASRRINVNAIAPGYIATRNTQALREDAQRNAAILDRIPAERWGQPQDLQGAVVFLASAASNYVHGAILAVDGGWLAR